MSLSQRRGGRLLERLSRTPAEEEAEDLARECRREGCLPIAQLRVRELASVTGCVHSLSVEPKVAHPRLAAELYDGTGILQLIWLGRRRIDGIHPGVFLTVQGRVTEVEGRLTMFNPGYHLLPAHD